MSSQSLPFLSLSLSPLSLAPLLHLIKVKDKDSKWWQLWHHIHYNAISSPLAPPSLLFNSPILVIKIGRFPPQPPDLSSLSSHAGRKDEHSRLVPRHRTYTRAQTERSSVFLGVLCRASHESHDFWADPWKLSHLLPPVRAKSAFPTTGLFQTLGIYLCVGGRT